MIPDCACVDFPRRGSAVVYKRFVKPEELMKGGQRAKPLELHRLHGIGPSTLGFSSQSPEKPPNGVSIAVINRSRFGLP